MCNYFFILNLMCFFEIVKDKVLKFYFNKIYCVNGFIFLIEIKFFLMGFFYFYVNVIVFMVKLFFFFVI